MAVSLLANQLQHEIFIERNLCCSAYNIEMSLEDLMSENVRVENYLQDHV